VSISGQADTRVPPAARPLTGQTLALLACMAAIGALSTNIILPSFPSMAAEFGVEARDLGITLSSFFIAFAAGQLFIGPLSDRFGRKWFVLGGLAVFVTGTAICGLAPSLDVLVLGRIVQALGVCAASVLSRAIARDLFEGPVLARVLSLTMIAMAAAPGFSPLVGSGLESGFGWRSTFAFVGFFGAGLAVAVYTGFGETHPPNRRAAQSLPEVLGAYLGLAADARFIRPALAVSLIIGGLYAFFGAAPAILMTLMGLSPFELGLFFAGTVFVVFGAGASAPHLARIWGPARAAAAGSLAALTGAAGLAVFAGDIGVAAFTGFVVLYLFGMGLANPLGTAIALQPFAEKAGLASALLGFLQMACAALGTALAASLPLPPVAALACVLAGASAFALVLLLAHAAPASRIQH
jgi:DHA1 family bicyclomycin/chloramphenicol resistance-like MFS transporter